MNPFLKALEQRLLPQDKEALRRVWAPRVVAVPPSDAWRNLCALPDGEIRSYGTIERARASNWGRRVYLASRDAGLSWKQYEVPDDRALGPSVQSPYSGRYMTAVLPTVAHLGFRPFDGVTRQGAYAVWAEHPDDTNLTWRKMSDLPIPDIRQPLPLRSRKRWVVPAQTPATDGGFQPCVLYSDDDGESWKAALLKAAPKHEIRAPHKGLRWQNGACEPTIVERSDGRLLLLARTSQDFHYQYESGDGGETWTDPVPSLFHATLTMPTLYRLSDGRMLHFWCNTQPLPELDHSQQWPPLREGELSGEGGEDVFTNRDANHAALSLDDGDTWLGFREVFLNPIRNDADFRTKGANDDTLDKSVHQFEAMELPYGKVLLQFGQHAASRRLVLLDPDWLLEKERHEDFRTGLGQLSTQVYLKSVSGNYRGFSGHCAWNRTHGAVLVPDPAGNHEEALLLSRIEDPRLFSPVQGVVWNFPAARAGQVRLRMRVEGQDVQLHLTDRWINPIDTAISGCAAFVASLSKADMPEEGWAEVSVVWDVAEKSASLCIDGKEVRTLPQRTEAPYGLCYLHIQTLARTADARGTLIKRLDFTAR